MKAIYVSGQQTELYPGTPTYTADVIADSAIGRDVMPLFLPDVPVKWTGNLCLALRIGRLGKSINPKFAHRYISEITVVLLLDTDRSIAGINRYIPLIDSAVTAGKWTDYDAQATDLTALIDDTPYHIPLDQYNIPQIISDISRNATVKSGDIIILGPPIASTPLLPGDIINVTLNTSSVLHIKVK